MAKIDWDTSENEVAAPRNFEALPKGRYLVQVDDTEMKQTRNKSGEYLEVRFVVLAPKEAKNRKLWARLNVKNPSEIAQRIGREQFNALAMAATGSIKVSKTESLHNKKLIVHVSVEKNAETGDLNNRIDGYEKYEGASGGASAPPAEERKPESKPAPAREPGSDDDDDIPF